MCWGVSMVMTCQIRLAIYSLRVPLFGVLRAFNAQQLIVSNECAHCQTLSSRRPNVGSLNKAEMERRKKRLRRGAARRGSSCLRLAVALVLYMQCTQHMLCAHEFCCTVLNMCSMARTYSTVRVEYSTLDQQQQVSL